MFAIALMLAYAAALAVAVLAQALPLWVAGALALVNGLTFGAYAIDKRAATQGRRRIRERSLWPGHLAKATSAVSMERR